MLKKLNVFVISGLAFALGINYCVFNWLDYDIIGLNGAFISSARFIWGLLQTFFGILLLGCLFLNNVSMTAHKIWNIVAAIVFVMQLPMTSLWYMSLMREPIASLLGVIIHTLLIGLITYDYLTSHKAPVLLNEPDQNNEVDSHIKLDT